MFIRYSVKCDSLDRSYEVIWPSITYEQNTLERQN